MYVLILPRKIKIYVLFITYYLLYILYTQMLKIQCARFFVVASLVIASHICEKIFLLHRASSFPVKYKELI